MLVSRSRAIVDLSIKRKRDERIELYSLKHAAEHEETELTAAGVAPLPLLLALRVCLNAAMDNSDLDKITRALRTAVDKAATEFNLAISTNQSNGSTGSSTRRRS